MKDRQTPQWADTLARCGLKVTGVDPAPTAPPLTAALYAVNGFEVRPTATIPLSLPQAASTLDETWHHHASRAPLYDEHGGFLILPPGSGGTTIGWVHVLDPIGKNLPSRIAEVTGSPEFMATSPNGRHLCAASVEEYEYWVVTHEF
ncbi:hypothetical protein [Streptomyces sp. CAI-85]|uniref:hypothetical protein n=1 Tax=Streptomyces sp. CAI-85 TaxID=1472662 RepID=UPI001587AF9E|nr:hypothetical protein [Streptomyces sp. CAI-85]NUV62498.1 hypothetical protein [Streptomyces sp. CAI-85]